MCTSVAAVTRNIHYVPNSGRNNNPLLFSFGRLSGMDIYTAVDNIRSGDPELQILGAAWIQHQCFNSNEAKVEVINKF